LPVAGFGRRLLVTACHWYVSLGRGGTRDHDPVSAGQPGPGRARASAGAGCLALGRAVVVAAPTSPGWAS